MSSIVVNLLDPCGGRFKGKRQNAASYVRRQGLQLFTALIQYRLVS